MNLDLVSQDKKPDNGLTDIAHNQGGGAPPDGDCGAGGGDNGVEDDLVVSSMTQYTDHCSMYQFHNQMDHNYDSLWTEYGYSVLQVVRSVSFLLIHQAKEKSLVFLGFLNFDKKYVTTFYGPKDKLS